MAGNSYLCNYPQSNKVVNFDYSQFIPSGATIGSVLLAGGACWTITGATVPGERIPEALYNNCYDCYVSNNAIVQFTPCFFNTERPIYFNFTDFEGFIPQANTTYNISFVSPIFGEGILNACGFLNVIIPKEGNLIPPTATLIEYSLTGYTKGVYPDPCKSCVENNLIPYEVSRCFTGESDIIGLLDGSLVNHTITYTVGAGGTGSTRYCGLVKGRAQLTNPITAFFVSDY